MTPPPKEMRGLHARLESFEIPHHLAKQRRASAQNKKKSTVEWPHQHPAPLELARAGFFYRPSHDSADNVQCFLCAIKLDGWEPTDDPLQEHLAHGRECAWAKAISVQEHDEEGAEPEARDPLGNEMLDVRRATFTPGDGWPHEDKKGWKCKINKMVEAGWAWDPATEGEETDGATCFYCNLSLDGWEPKDDPFHEHKRRAPACRFFELLELYHGVDVANGKVKKSKGRGKAAGRASTSSKLSRMSIQSAMSQALSIPGSFGDALEDGSVAGVDDSVVTTATDASRVTAMGSTKGMKKAARPKTTARAGKAKTTAPSKPDITETGAQYQDAGLEIQDSFGRADEPPLPMPAKAMKRGVRASKQADSSVIEISQIESSASTQKAKRGRKVKVQPPLEQQRESVTMPETPDVAVVAQQRLSEVSAQLQEELEHSVDNFEPPDESTPVVNSTKPQRGVKRTSDGLRKQADEIEPRPVELDAPVLGDVKGKRGRPKKASAAFTIAEPEKAMSKPLALTVDHGTKLDMSEVRVAPAAKKGRGRPTGKIAASARSSRSSKATVAASEANEIAEQPEDLARDELEIERELERIANEQSSRPAIRSEHDQVEEFEPTPSQVRISKDSADIHQLQIDIEGEGETTATKDFAFSGRRSKIPGGFTPSPSGSDKENQPSSAMQPKQSQATIVLSPTKTVRIPLAASTPIRSPSKVHISPSKQMSHLTSQKPWTAVDLDTALLASPQRSPGKVSQQLVAAAGALTSPEKKMNVEEWVRYRAEKSEEELRNRCELLVAAFEKEGMRGLDSLNGVQVVG